MYRFQLKHVLPITALVLLTVAHTPSNALSEELSVRVREIANAAIKSRSDVGISIGVAHGDEILLAEGYGLADIESETPATSTTVYRIGSITKQFTAAAILQLAEREKLSLDDDLTKHLPDHPAHDPPVTLRHLLQHTSGMKSFTSLPTYRQLMREDVSHDKIIQRFVDLPFNFDPGERFKYCNSGYYLLGVIVESVGEQPYENYLVDNLFEPLGLKQTYYDRTRRIIPGRARGYRRNKNEFENSPYLSMTQPFAAGALASTVTDLIRWQRGLINHKLLNATSYKTMTTPGIRSNGKPIDYGIGLFIRNANGRPTIGHGGGINGFRSDLTYYPESDHTIVVLANCENAQPGQISKQVAKHLFRENARD